MNEDTGVLFKEVQKFRQTWLWVLLIVVFLQGTILLGRGIFQQLVLNKPWGKTPMSDSMLVAIGIVYVIIVITIPGIFYIAKLMTEVRRDGLYFRFIPFHRSYHAIPFEAFKTYESCTYRPVRDYGGYGIHRGLKGKAYNVSGNRGIRLELIDGKRILIGSQMPEELKRAIDAAMGKR